MFTKEELNALGLIVSNSTGFKGSDAAFIAALLSKIDRLMKEENAESSMEN